MRSLFLMNLWSKQALAFIYSKLRFLQVKRHKRVKTQSKLHNDGQRTNLAFEWVWQIHLRSHVTRLKNWWRSCRAEESPNCPHTSLLNKTQQADTWRWNWSSIYLLLWNKGFIPIQVTRHHWWTHRYMSYRWEGAALFHLLHNVSASEGWCGGRVMRILVLGSGSWFSDRYRLKYQLVYWSIIIPKDSHSHCFIIQGTWLDDAVPRTNQFTALDPNLIQAQVRVLLTTALGETDSGSVNWTRRGQCRDRLGPRQQLAMSGVNWSS